MMIAPSQPQHPTHFIGTNGIPGTGLSGDSSRWFPNVQRGEVRALGAAFTASLFGGLFGAMVWTGAIFAARPIILMGFGEQMMLIMLASV